MAVALPLIAVLASGVISAQQTRAQNRRLDAAAKADASPTQAGASDTSAVAGTAATVGDAKPKRNKGTLLGSGAGEVDPATATAPGGGLFAARKTLLGG